MFVCVCAEIMTTKHPLCHIHCNTQTLLAQRKAPSISHCNTHCTTHYNAHCNTDCNTDCNTLQHANVTDNERPPDS